jgi:natural product precursor
MTKKNAPKKLSLTRLTIKELDRPQLKLVGGGLFSDMTCENCIGPVHKVIG